MVRKDSDVDLRAKYNTTLEVAIIVSLCFAIVAFKFFPHIEPPKRIEIKSQEVVDVEDVNVTRQENRPPPPPRPAIPIEGPSDEAIDDIPLSTELDVREEVAPPPPPPDQDMSDEESYFVAVEELPEPIGGISAIQKAVIYPEIAKRAGVEGLVVVQAWVDETGNVTRAEVMKGIGAGCDEAAVAAVKQAKFKPGKQRGKAVRVKMSIPVRFRLQR